MTVDISSLRIVDLDPDDTQAAEASYEITKPLQLRFTMPAVVPCGLYATVALAQALSYPVTPQPLSSLPRYELVLFPLFMWGAIWVRRRGLAVQAIAVSAVLLGVFTAEFATWRFVA